MKNGSCLPRHQHGLYYAMKLDASTPAASPGRIVSVLSVTAKGNIADANRVLADGPQIFRMQELWKFFKEVVIRHEADKRRCKHGD